MNESIENFLKTCNFLSKKIDVVSSFKSRTYEINRISNIVFLAVLIIPTVLLNAVAAITIWKTSQLRKKPCYFVILLQSSVDLGVGCVALPISFVALLAPFTTNVDICAAILIVKTVSMLLSGVSIITMSALTVERYIGVLHPYSYNTLVTKRRIVMFVLVLMLLLIIVVLTLSQYATTKTHFGSGFLAIFLIFTSFSYTRIYLVIRRLSRSEVIPHEDGSERGKKRRRVPGELKNAISSFMVVIFFFILLVPYVLIPILLPMGKMNLNVYIWWCITLMYLNSSVNSVIFFWRSKVLRKQAVKILKQSKR